MDNDDEEELEEEQKDSLGEYEGDRNELEERHGHGKAILPNGDKYIGMYAHGKRHGTGTYIFKKNHCRYSGDYSENKKHGRGYFAYPDGSHYEGDWAQNRRHGEGTYAYRNGDIYNGEWKDDKRHGVGAYKVAATGETLFGQWKQGKCTGHAELIRAGHKYVGRLKNNQPIGKGRFIFDIGMQQNGHYVGGPSEACEANKDEEEIIEDSAAARKWMPTDITEVLGETGVIGIIEEETRIALEEFAYITVLAIQKAAQDQLAEEMRLEQLALDGEGEEEEEHVN